MIVTVRTDASVNIGSGHVMRCLTLANELVRYGIETRFAMRPQLGDLCDYVEDKGFKVIKLSPPSERIDPISTSDYAAWLQVPELDDVDEFIELVGDTDIVIVDHYGINKIWERKVKSEITCKLMVIDDLVREHQADLVLDQNLGRTISGYREIINNECIILSGTDYSLLREEFYKFRSYSLDRRKFFSIKRILITLGGSDKDNLTTDILNNLSSLSIDCVEQVTVIIGSMCVWEHEISEAASRLPCNTIIKKSVSNMAELMAEHDLCIGATGGTSWERCCLGLPTISLVISENQIAASKQLERSGAIVSINSPNQVIESINNIIKFGKLEKMSIAAAKLVDGLGTMRVTKKLLELANVKV